MNTKLFAGTALLFAAAILLFENRGLPQEKTSTFESVRHPVSRKPLAHAQSTVLSSQESGSPDTDSNDDESANLSHWQSLFSKFVNDTGDRKDAEKMLLEEIDHSFSEWAASEIEAASSLDPVERMDRLSIAEISVQEGAAAVLEQLEIEGGRLTTLAAGALESLAAEIQYAESAPDHDSRVALLRIDQERERKLAETLAIADDASRSRSMLELDQWYEKGLAGIFPANPADE